MEKNGKGDSHDGGVAVVFYDVVFRRRLRCMEKIGRGNQEHVCDVAVDGFYVFFLLQQDGGDVVFGDGDVVCFVMKTGSHWLQHNRAVEDAFFKPWSQS